MTLCKIGRKIKREKSKLGQYQENPSGLADIYGQGGKTLRYICYPVYPRNVLDFFVKQGLTNNLAR